jgi:hypothetical protein
MGKKEDIKIITILTNEVPINVSPVIVLKI